VPAARSKQFGSAQDQQRRGRVAELECGDRQQKPPELTSQDRSDAQAQRRALVFLQSRGRLDRDEDRCRREEAGNEREQDRIAHADQRDEPESQQWSGDRPQVVQRALEAVGSPVGPRRD